MKLPRVVFVFLILSAFVLPSARAYIDPGSGGYLISAFFAAIGGFLAFGTAVMIHFFRHTLVNWLRFVWNKHRFIFVACVLLIPAGTGAGIFFAFRRPPTPAFDPSISGVHVYQSDKTADGYNLFEGRLMDMRGNTVRRWSSVYLGTLDTNGDYYAQKYFEAPVWGRYTWDDKVIWEKNFPIHHQILLTPQDTIITFTKEVHPYQGRNVEFDVILELDKNGDELQRFSLWENLKIFQEYHRKLELDQPPAFIIPESHRKDTSVWGGNYDYYHLNALTLVPHNRRESAHPAFKPGNWIISFRHGSMIFILDRDTKKILWRAIYDQVEGRLEGPHSPQMLESGNILVFDNGRYRGWSRVAEIDPVTLKIVWEYRDKDFYTLSQGHVQRLSNSNLLITEAERGRVFEITPEKELAWEYYHPDKQNASNSTEKKKWGLRQEIYSMIRYPEDFIDGL